MEVIILSLLAIITVVLIFRKKIPGQRGYEYFATKPTEELLPILLSLGDWGMRWAKEYLTDEDYDVDFLMLYLNRSIIPANIPGKKTVIKFKFLDIDCSKIQDSLTKSADRDQEVRSGLSTGKKMQEVDQLNKELVITILEKCGWDKIDDSQINGVFLVLQHSSSELMARYYPKFVELYANGILSDINYARMIDRLQMNFGYPQTYGTQVVGKSFYHIDDIKNVNERRSSINLNTLEESANRYGFEFKMEDYVED